MKKRIVAAVLSLLIAASSVPMAEFASFIPDTSITATAATKKTVKVTSPTGAEVDVAYEIAESSGQKTLKLTLPDQYYPNEANIEIDTTNIQEALGKAGVATTGYKDVELNYKFGLKVNSKLYHSVLASVEFKDSFITRLGSSLFGSNEKLTSVKLSSSIKSIGKSAFSGLKSFVGNGTDNTIDLSNVVEIEDGAFSSCPLLLGVKLSKNLTAIGGSAFSSCTNLKTITIPASVTSIGKNAFSSDTALTAVTFESGSQLTTLGESAFSSCSLLEKVVVGNTTTNTLPSKIASVGKSVFQSCVKLQSFVIPASLETLPESMFNSCTALNVVDFSKVTKLTSIPKDCFSSCTSIVNLTLPDSVTSIEPGAFSGCEKLQKLLVSDAFDTFVAAKSDTNTFAGCPVLSLAQKSKKDKLQPNQILIPDGVTHIPAGCFVNCTGVTKFDLRNVESIAEGAFAGCTSLPSINIPEPVTILHKNLFKGCTKLKDVTYSSQLSEIKENVFDSCTSLVTFTPSNKSKISNTIQITPSCAAIQDSAFVNCSSFKYINVLLDAQKKSKLSNLGKSVFSGCTSLEGATTDGTSSQELRFPSGVILIRDKTFYNCKNLKVVQFEGNVTTLGASVFQSCTALKQVIVNPTITQILDSAFSGCTSLTSLPVTDKSGTTTAVAQLEEIDKNTFNKCTSLKVADMSTATKLKTINDSAFTGCTALTRVILPTTGQLSSIGSSVFSGCTALATVNTSKTATDSVFPNYIVSIGDSAFKSTVLTKVTITKPKDTTAYNLLGDSVFAGCSKLTEADFGNSNLITLPKNIFSGDKALTKVTLPTTLVTIDESAFNGCENLSKINSPTKGTAQLPVNVKSIKGTAFQNNHNIAKFVIPAATDDIDLSAFNATLTYSQADIDSGKYNPLKEFVVDANNANFKATNGVLYTKDGTKLLRYPTMKAGKSFSVPSGVTTMITASMGSNNLLETVKISNSVKKIESKAFNNMTSLRAVDFGTNTDVVFASDAFSQISSNPKLVFYGAAGSTAEAYANKNSKSIIFIDNSKKATKVTIKQGTNISLSRSGSITLEPVFTTASGEVTTDTISWISNNTSVVSVSNEGKLSAKGDGSTTVVGTTSGGLTVTVSVSVGDQVTRLAGDGRYATAAEISKSGFATANTVVLAYGLNSADALAGVPLAKAYNAPILLTTTKKLPAETLAEIKRLKASNVIILGGTGAISAAVEKTLMDNGLTTERIAGGSRFETATKIAEKLAEKNGSKPTEVFFVYAYNFADALSASTVAAVKGAPVIYLKTKGDMDKETADYLASVKGSVQKAYVIGGTGVISDPMMKTAANALGLKSGSTVTRIAGSNRYVTCVEVNKAFASDMSGTALCIATGADFPDALAGGVFAAINKAPLFLVNNAAKKLDATQTAYLKEKQAKRFFVFGGTGAVSDATVKLVKAVK